MASLWFEDFEIGAEKTTEPRPVTDGDIRAFAEVSGDHNPLHLDEEYAASGPFGRRIAHGLLVLVLASGLMNASGLTAETLVAFLGLDWSFKRPVFPGDVIRVRMRVAQTRPTRDPERGLVKLDLAVLNQ
ncbi:MAG TPA: MaoC/PaaZ C-terminal domain-containing protein, partial [Longimicrobiales bacterium]